MARTPRETFTRESVGTFEEPGAVPAYVDVPDVPDVPDARLTARAENPAEAEADAAKPEPDGWMDFPNPMPHRLLNDYPFTGSKVQVTPDRERVVDVVWRETRSFDSRMGKWGKVCFWSRVDRAGQQIDFFPVAWRRPPS